MHAVFKRYLCSMASAVAITATLILIMHAAIENDEVVYETPAKLRILEMFRRLPETVIPPPQPPQPPDEIEQPPQTDVKFEPTGGDPSPYEGVVPTPAPSTENVSLLADGDMLPIMTVPPEYPPRLLSRGVQGWVVVEFTVDELGRVQAPRVIQAQPGNGFNRAALSAVQRYKYKPRVVNGAAVAVPGVRQRIVFNVDS